MERRSIQPKKIEEIAEKDKRRIRMINTAFLTVGMVELETVFIVSKWFIIPAIVTLAGATGLTVWSERMMKKNDQEAREKLISNSETTISS